MIKFQELKTPKLLMQKKKEKKTLKEKQTH